MELKNMFYIDEKDWHELQGWAGLAYQKDKNEISGLMTAIPQKDGRFKITDVEILKQENSGTSTELDADAVAAYKMKYAMKYQNKDMKFVWWHSHHTMGAFWSGTDLTEINAWKNESFSLALVINLKEEYVFRVSLWNASGIPIEQHFDIPLEIERTAKPVITKEMKVIYDELCEDDTPVNPNIYVGGRVWNNNYQTNLLSKGNRVDSFNYQRIKDKIETLCDEFLMESLTFTGFKKELTSLRKECITKKFDFKVMECNINKGEAIDQLPSTFPEEFFEFEDNHVKMLYQSADDGWSYGGYHV